MSSCEAGAQLPLAADGLDRVDSSKGRPARAVHVEIVQHDEPAPDVARRAARRAAGLALPVPLIVRWCHAVVEDARPAARSLGDRRIRSVSRDPGEPGLRALWCRGDLVDPEPFCEQLAGEKSATCPAPNTTCRGGELLMAVSFETRGGGMHGAWQYAKIQSIIAIMQMPPAGTMCPVSRARSRAQAWAALAQSWARRSTMSRPLPGSSVSWGSSVRFRTPDGLVATRQRRWCFLPPKNGAWHPPLCAATDRARSRAEGLVRVSAPPGIAFRLPPAAFAGSSHASRLRIELDSSKRVVDLTRREADLAIPHRATARGRTY